MQLSVNLELACFVCYLKIVNTFMKKIMYASFGKLFKKLKSRIKICVGQSVLELLIKTIL